MGNCLLLESKYSYFCITNFKIHKMKKMILITGATGQLGGATVDFLLGNGVQPDRIAVLARSPEKAQRLESLGIDIRIGDYNDLGSLEQAFIGVEKLFFISSGEIENRGAQHKNVLSAAAKVGVEHIVYTGIERNLQFLPSPLAFVSDVVEQTEKWIRDSGMKYTILKNNLYMDVVGMFIGEGILETKSMTVVDGSGKVGFVLRSDLAEASANILSGGAHENRVYHLSNVDVYDYHDIARYLHAITGFEIDVISVSPDIYRERLLEKGMPEQMADSLTAFAHAQALGEFQYHGSDLEMLLGRKPTSMVKHLEGIFANNKNLHN